MVKAERCGCGHGLEKRPTGACRGRYVGDERVGDVARDPGALAVLERFGLHHCCAGDLSLRAGAAAAGADLPALLRALDEAAGASRPVGVDRPQVDERGVRRRHPTSAPEPPMPSPVDAETLDVRGLEPPRPMVRVLERLEALEPGGVLTVLHDRRPVFLYPQLDDRGLQHETDEPAPGLVRIVIRKSRS